MGALLDTNTAPGEALASPRLRREGQGERAFICAAVICLALLLLAGCAVGPNYKRPPVGAPDAFRGETPAGINSFADLPWWGVFRDEKLQELIRVALTNNYDLRIAFT